MTDPRTRLVADGYDAMADTWEAWRAQIADDPRAEWLDELVTRLPDGARGTGYSYTIGTGGSSIVRPFSSRRRTSVTSRPTYLRSSLSGSSRSYS